MTQENTTSERTAGTPAVAFQRFVRAKDLLANDWPMSLARNPNDEGAFDGSCPCGTITGENFVVEFHCWRSSCQHGCKYSGIHVSGTLDRKTKMKIAKHVRDNNGWTNHTDWSLVILGPNAPLQASGADDARKQNEAAPRFACKRLLGGANVNKTMNGNYILDGKTPIKCDNALEWAQWFEKAERHVAQENVGKVRISTVFLGLDHGWGELKPVLFETMVFGGPLDQEQVRYYTWDEAEAGHREMVERVKASPPNDPN